MTSKRGARSALLLAALALACAKPGPATVPPPAPAPVALKPLADSARFASEINAFAKSDSASPPPEGAVLFVGSSSIRFWDTLAADFPGLAVINRGFGGSRMDDLLRYADRIVFPYEPKTIVLYEGDNDIADNRSPARIAGDVAEFLSRVRNRLPGTRVIYLSIKPSPSRWAMVDRTREANALVERVVENDTSARYVDVFTPMLGANGRPRPELFRDDSLHMTRAGYELWRGILDPVVRAAVK